MQPTCQYQQQPYQQGQPTGPTEPKPDNYLIWAILSTICCCLPFGIVSIVYAAKVNSLYYSGQYAAARQNADEAKKWAIVSAVSGIIISAIYLIWYILVGAASLAGAFWD